MDRRDFLLSSAAVAGTSLFADIAEAAPALDMTLMPSEKSVWAEVEEMNNLGARYCGNAAHMTYMKSLDDRLAALGLTVNNLNHNTLVFWEPKTVSIKAKNGEAIPVGAFSRWCAVTGDAGITGPLAYVGLCEGPSRFSLSLYPERRSKMNIPADLKGKIALIDVAADKRPFDLLYPAKDIASYFDKDRSQPFPPNQGPSASNQALLPDHIEDDLKKAGAIGVIYAWAGLSDADAQGQARNGTDALPSAWVVPTVGAKLRKLADSGEPVTFTVTATIVDKAPTRTIVATLPGMSEESIILWTHTDGQNAIEENGGLAILAMVRYLAKLPKEQRKRTIQVVMPEGHFAEQYVPTSAWIKERPELCEKAVALVSIEHLGCTEWLSDAKANTYKPSGQNEIAFAFCPTKAIQDAGADAMKGQKIGREVIVSSPAHSVSPGIAAYRQTGVPCFSYISVPSYLLADSDNGHIGKLSSKLFYEQTLMLMRLVRGLDETPKSVLRPSA